MVVSGDKSSLRTSESERCFVFRFQAGKQETNIRVDGNPQAVPASVR